MLMKKDAESAAVRSVQEMLRFLGFMGRNRKPLVIDGKFREQTENAVLNFQASEGLLRDGIVGPSTMAALEKAWTARSIELNSPGVDAFDGMPDRLTFDRVQADAYGDGYDRLSLRTDVATAYRTVYTEVHRRGGILTSSGGIRSLHATLNASRSATSMHYLGRALDLYIYSGMTDPKKDPYVIAREAPLTYRVYARCNPDQAEDGMLPEQVTLKKLITYDTFRGRRPVFRSATGHFLDLTDLFQQHGFERIRAKPLFEQGSSMMGAEWWHFQYEKGLISSQTTFGSQLLKVYSHKTLEGTPPWQYRDRVYGINWG